MDIRKAQEVMNAICTVADFLGISEQQAASNVCFLDKKMYSKIFEANKLVNSFNDMSLADRGRALGYEVKETPNAVEVSTAL